MTKGPKTKSDKFKINLRNAVNELATAMYAVDREGLGFNKNEYEDKDAVSCIFKALKDIKKAVLLYEKECDFIDLP